MFPTRDGTLTLIEPGTIDGVSITVTFSGDFDAQLNEAYNHSSFLSMGVQILMSTSAGDIKL